MSLVNPPDEHQLLNGYLDEIVSESKQAVKNYEREWEDNMKFYRGEQWQTRLPSHRIAFTANYTKTSVKRLVALITDTKPTIEVRTRVRELVEMTKECLTPVVRANWDEQGYDQIFAGSIIPKAIVLGCCGAHTYFNPSLDQGRGDVTIAPIDPRSLILDPSVTRAADVDDMSYAGFRTVLPLTRIQKLFPLNGRLVKADPVISHFLDKTPASAGYESPGHRILARATRGQATESYAVARAPVEEFYIDDARLVHELPTDLQERAHKRGLLPDDLAWPGGRRIVRAGTNKIILYDGPNPYIDRKKPLDIFDWGLETEHLWGDSEVRLIKSLQAILNKLGSAITENAVKMNNNIWIGDRDALEKNEWKLLNDAPGLLVKVKPGRQLRRESAPALPGSVFQMIQWLTNVIDTLTGLVEATQGRRPIGIVSSHAIEALQLAAQTLIRLQARKFEAFLMRVGQKLVARIFQFFTTDRLMHIIGPGGKLEPFHFERQKLIGAKVLDQGKPRDFDVFKDLRDLTFHVTPGSSMAITRLQKGQMALGLHAQGLIPRVQVLEALEWDDPEGTADAALKEQMTGIGAGQMADRSKRIRQAA